MFNTKLCTPPKVLIIDLSLKYGGSSSRVISLIKDSPSGSIALAGLSSGAVITEAAKIGLPVHVVGKRKTDPMIVFRILKLIRQHNYQVMDTQNVQSKFWGSLASIFSNTALVSTINSWYANEHGKTSNKGKLYTQLELLTNWGLDLYITVSKKDKLSLLNSKIPENKIELIYNAVNVDVDAIPDSPEWLQRKFQLPPKSLVCTAVGRLVPIKGYDVLINAAKQVVAKSPNLYFLIVGDGEERENLENQIKRSGLERNILLAGYQDRQSVLAILNSSDFFVMPSRYEGTPIALLEAAAFGKPIVASNSGGIPELVENEVHALLVPPEDPAALADALNRFCTNPEAAKRLGKKAQERVGNQFNLENQIKRTWEAYQKAFDNHKRSRNG